MKPSSYIPVLPAEEYERLQYRANSKYPELWSLLDEIKDPEIPVISIWELGILQDVGQSGDTVTAVITPTYSGCPALDVITEDIQAAFSAAGYLHSKVEVRLAPAWSSRWILSSAQDKLRAYGIAPPGCSDQMNTPEIACPQCGSLDLRLVSQFGSTACKALYQCRTCAEPFDYFKPI